MKKPTPARAQALRAAIAEFGREIEGGPLPISASFGVATATDLSLNERYAQAIARCASAKDAGRDRVCAGPEVEMAAAAAPRPPVEPQFRGVVRVQSYVGFDPRALGPYSVRLCLAQTGDERVIQAMVVGEAPIQYVPSAHPLHFGLPGDPAFISAPTGMVTIVADLDGPSFDQVLARSLASGRWVDLGLAAELCRLNFLRVRSRVPPGVPLVTWSGETILLGAPVREETLLALHAAFCRRVFGGEALGPGAPPYASARFLAARDHRLRAIFTDVLTPMAAAAEEGLFDRVALLTDELARAHPPPRALAELLAALFPVERARALRLRAHALACGASGVLAAAREIGEVSPALEYGH